MITTASMNPAERPDNGKQQHGVSSWSHPVDQLNRKAVRKHTISHTLDAREARSQLREDTRRGRRDSALFTSDGHLTNLKQAHNPYAAALADTFGVETRDAE